MKPEAQEKTRAIDRDATVCTPQIYRLICISGPGKKTGCRILKRSATVVVQTGEQPAGSGTCRPEMPAEPQAMVSGLPEGARKSGPEVPADSGQIGPQEPAGNNNHSPEQPAPENTGGDTR